MNIETLEKELKEHQDNNLKQHNEMLATNREQQAIIDRIVFILEGDKGLKIKGMNDKLNEIYENFSGASWFSKTALRMFISLGAIVAAILGILELIKKINK